jgi:hypothetical protein
MFCAPELIFSGTEGVPSRFHVFRSRTCFRRYRGRRVPFFMFYAPGLVFGGTDGIWSRLNDLRARTHFQRYRGRRVLFSCFVRPDSFSAVPRVSGLVFLFCTPGLVFGGTEGVPSRFLVSRSRTCLWPYRGRRVLFSCFVLPDSSSAVQRASGQFFMFCAPELASGGTEGVVSRFLILCSWTHFRRYRGRRVPFSCFARPGSFSVVPMASSPVFMF